MKESFVPVRGRGAVCHVNAHPAPGRSWLPSGEVTSAVTISAGALTGGWVPGLQRDLLKAASGVGGGGGEAQARQGFEYTSL